MAKTEWRYGGISYTDAGIALLNENDRASRRTRTWILEPGAAPRKVWDRKQDAAYDNPGTPVTRRDAGAPARRRRRRRRRRRPDHPERRLHLPAGAGRVAGRRSPVPRPAEPEDAPDRADLPIVVGVARIVRRAAERRDDPFPDALRDAEGGAELLHARRRLRRQSARSTQFKDPQPRIRDILRQYVTYKRKDGVTLSGTLYLPPGYKQGTKVPVIMWAYPREFGDADSASQVSGSPNSFTAIRGASHMFLLLSGYAIFDNPTMPIIGPGETANDTYVEQLVASAQAAIDKVVEMGVADRDRIGVGGHSYGGFMTANLLAHSRLFRAGFAESGAYNRSLTPLGFQAERRIVLGGAGHLHEDVAVLVRAPDQGSDPADARRGGRQHRHVPDPVGASVRGAQGPRRDRALRDAAARGARLRRARDAAARARRAAQLVRQVREERRRPEHDRRLR